LKLVFNVPLQKPIPSRHLVVPLPVSAVSHIKMTLPFSSVKPTVLPEKAVWSVTPAGAGKTAIEVIGLGSHLDLSWQPNIDVRPNDVSLESQTTIYAQINADQVNVRASQKLYSLSGQFDRVSVTLPTEAELISLEGPERPSIEIDPEKRQQAIVTFREKISSAQLNWTLRLPAKLRSPLTIDGFVVEESRKSVVQHSGTIGLSLAQGLQFSDRRGPTYPTLGQTLPGIQVSEFPSTMGPVDRAYKFITQPFKLVTIFDEVKPSFEVKPQLALIASPHQLTLEGDFEFRVDRFSLNEVALTWPNLKSEGWTIDNVEEPGVVDSYTPPDDKGQIIVRLAKSFSRTFSIRIRAHRQFRPNDDVLFTLPRPRSASRLSPTTLILINAENVETELTVRDETVMRPLPSSSLETASIPKSAKDLKAMAFRIDTDEQSFGLHVIPKKQRLHTETFIEAKWHDTQFRLVQHLYYNIEYERLNQIRLIVPPAIDIERCQFLTAKNVSLKPETYPSPPGSNHLIQLKLSDAPLGKCEIQVVYYVPFVKFPASDTQALVELPFFESSDEPFSQTRVSLSQSDWFDAEPSSIDMWQPQRNRQDAWEWLADGSQPNLSLKLVRSTRGNETGNVSMALVKVTLDETGDGMVRAQFRVSTRATLLPVRLPSNAKSAEFYWNNKLLTNRECIESPVGSHHYVIEPERTDVSGYGEHLLTIEYHEKFGSKMGLSDGLTLQSPILMNCSWNKVFWQVELPSGQHLLTYPPSAATLFHWQRTGFVWSRVSDYDSEFLQKKLVEGIVTLPNSDDDLSRKNGNSYLFRQLDSPKPLVFQTLSSSMTLLLGAGFSLLAGFVTLRVVVLRHVLTLLLLALIVAITGLWYSAPLQLLLQPMIAGLLLPVAAVLLEGWIRKRYDISAIPFERPGEFPPLHAFGGSHFIVRQTDPNEATLHRLPSRESESSMRIESGSGVS
jgi:hypothetical protein